MAKIVRKMDLDIDLSAMADLLGAAEALTSVERDQSYVDDIVKAAHGQAEDEFNSAAAAAGAAGSIKHMFEWGTIGINKGRTNMRPQPMSERARLWTNVMQGHGFRHTLSFVFKPSLAFVPKPTVEATGMDPDVIASLQDHVFQWKARVMESGEMVTIVPKNAKFLLIPYYKNAPAWFRNYDIERGYALSKGPHRFSPGDAGGTMGNFTSFWLGFWQGRGSEIINGNLDKQLEQDFISHLRSQSRRARLQASGSFEGAIKAERARIQRKARANARRRLQQS